MSACSPPVSLSARLPTHLLFPQSPTLEHYTQYALGDLTGCLREMHAMTAAAHTCEQQAVREKYGRPHFQHVSSVLVSGERPAPSTHPQLPIPVAGATPHSPPVPCCSCAG